jgi:ribosomal-protein-alanine N-acetyltransferase
MAADVCFRKALPADLPAILALEQVCPEAPHWPPYIWLEILNDQQGTVPLRAAFVAESYGGLLGFVVAAVAAQLSELESIAVDAHARRQGIGKALCLHAFHWSRSAGAAEIELEVRASSGAALSLYHSLGFTQQGMRRAYYRDPADDAVLMSARL